MQKHKIVNGCENTVNFWQIQIINGQSSFGLFNLTIWTNRSKFDQVWTSLNKFNQVWVCLSKSMQIQGNPEFVFRENMRWALHSDHFRKCNYKIIWPLKLKTGNDPLNSQNAQKNKSTLCLGSMLPPLCFCPMLFVLIF